MHDNRWANCPAATFCSGCRSDTDQFITARAEADLFGVCKAAFPLRFRRAVDEVIVMIHKIGPPQVVRKLAVRHRLGGQAGIRTGLVERHRVKRGEHADIRQDRGVVFTVAVAVGRDVHYQRDVERRPPIDDRLGVFGHAAVELVDGGAVRKGDRIKIACAEAAPAAHAVGGIHGHFVRAGIVGKAAVCTFPFAPAAAAAALRVNLRLPVGVLFLLSGAGAATHPDVFDRTAKSSHFMPLEMGQTDKHIRIHHRAADARLLDELAARNGDGYVIRSLEPVGNKQRAAGRERRKPVFPGTLQMLQRVFTLPRIHGVAIRQEWLSAQIAHELDHGARIVWPQVAHVAKLAKVHLNGDEFAAKVDLFDSSGPTEFLQFLWQSVRKCDRTKIRKVNLCLFHFYSPVSRGFSGCSGAASVLLLLYVAVMPHCQADIPHFAVFAVAAHGESWYSIIYLLHTKRGHLHGSFDGSD